MKIFYVTNISNKHPYTTAFARLWQAAGHDVRLFEMYGFEHNPVYQESNASAQVQMNRDFVNQCLEYTPDILFVFKGDTIFEESLREIKDKIHPKMITWWVDNPFVFIDSHYRSRVYGQTVKSLPLWDYFFVFETYSVTRLRRMNIPAYYLPSAADPAYFKMIEQRDAVDAEFYGSDVAFVGSPDKSRAEIIRAIDGHNIKLWGPAWDDSYFAEKQPKSNISIEEVCKIFNYAKIHLSRHFYVNVTGANIRTFDVPACGGFLLSDRMHDMVNGLFEENKEIICYDDLKDLKDKVSYFLSHEDERKEIAANAHKRVMKEHLFEYRFAEMGSIIG